MQKKVINSSKLTFSLNAIAINMNSAEKWALDEHWMKMALRYAKESGEQGEVPVGAVLISNNGDFLAAAGNCPIRLNDPSAHAEILAIRAGAGQLQNYRLPDTTLYVTLEPCIMCMGALIQARISRLVFGAPDPKTGAAYSIYAIGSDTRLNHSLRVTGGVLSDECGQLLKTFFRQRRSGGPGDDCLFLKTL